MYVGYGAQPLVLVHLARLSRDIRCRIVQPQIGLQTGFEVFGDHHTGLVRLKPVNHCAIEARCGAQRDRSRRATVFDARGFGKRGQKHLQLCDRIARARRRASRWLQLEQHGAPLRAQYQVLGYGAAARDDAEAQHGSYTHGGRSKLGADEGERIAVQQARQSPPDQSLRIDANEELGVAGRLFDRQILTVDDQ